MTLESIRLNSAPTSLFESTGAEREDIVAAGRLLMYECNGREGARVRQNSQFESRLDGMNYQEFNEKFSRKMMMYAAKIAANQLGEQAPENYEAFVRTQSQYFTNETFLRVLAGITRDVVTPLLPYVTSNVLGTLAQTVTVPIGQTYEITVKSNDAFIFQDSSWGASRSVPKNYLYDYPITINPTPRSAAAKIKWYQLVGNNGSADIGRYYNALAAGMSNKILALWNNAMTTAATSAQFVPDYLRFTSYTTENWVNAAKAVSMANGVPRERLMAYGDFAALSKILPSGTSQDAALSTLLGAEWFNRGFIGTVMGIPVTELSNAYVAGQVNLPSPTQMLSTSTIYMAARAGEGYAPIYIAFEDRPIVLEMTPDRTGDQSIDVNMTVSVAAAACFATKIAIISNVE